MKTNLISIGILLFISFYSCKKDAVPESTDYPFVILSEVSGITSEGATFNANITNLGNQRILDYGFVWDNTIKPTMNSVIKSLGNHPTLGEYSYKINNDLEKGKTYNVRAYLKTDKVIVYSNNHSFISLGSLPPKITSFTPSYGPIGTKVIINGENFAFSKKGNIVCFGNMVGIVDSVSENRLIVTTPEITISQKDRLSIEVAGMKVFSKDSFDNWFPWKLIRGVREMNFIYRPVSFSIQDKIFFGSTYGNTFLYEYDPYKDLLISRTPFPKNINALPCCFTIKNRGYVLFSGSRANTVKEFWEYNSESNLWTMKANFPGSNRVHSIAFNINDKGYIVTGIYWDDSGYNYYPKDLWEYNPISDSWTKKTDFLGIGRADGYGFSIGTNGYVGMGSTGWPQREFYKYDQQNNTWIYANKYPGISVNYLNGFTIGNKSYMGLGGEADFWEFDSLKNTFAKMRSCPVKVGYSLAYSINNKGYIVSYYQSKILAIYEFDPKRN